MKKNAKCTHRLCLLAALVVAGAFVAPQAWAQTPAAGKPAAAPGAAGKPGGKAADANDYGYKFEDDPLSAGGFGPNDASIRVRPGPVRMTLIRPRTSFVPEMIKSVENI